MNLDPVASQAKTEPSLSLLKRKVRSTGFDCPPGFSQVSSWVFAAFTLGSFSLTAVVHLTQEELPTGEVIGFSILSTLYAVGYLGMIVTTALVTASDPTDPTVKLFRAIRNLGDDAEVEQEAIVSEKARYFCQVCETLVLEHSKHCAICNRCCAGFDHHCRWVRNCVGRVNYVLFLRMLLFVALTLALQAVMSAITVATKDERLVTDMIRPWELRLLNTVALVFVILLLVLVVYLLSYHAWLIARGLSTF